MPITYWLLVERLENWKTDEQEGFLRFGMPERKRKLAEQIEAGDHLIFYVASGVSKISDIRIAAGGGIAKLAGAGKYDTAFPFAIHTRPHLVLPRDAWVPFSGLVKKLSFTAAKLDWRQTMRNGLRRLDKEDGLVLENAIKRAVN